MNKDIPIFFTIDNGYAPFLAAALNSAISNSSPENRYKAIILHQSVSEENQIRIKQLATEWFTVEFIPMQNSMGAITDRMSNRLRCDYFTLTIYFRLFIPAMFPEYKKAIYLDSDVIVKGDLAELFYTELGENYLAACPDHSIEDVPSLVRYTTNAIGMEKGAYFNSGVLLMNTELLREKQLDAHFLSLLNAYHFDTIAPDQDYLNAMCCGKVLYLDEIWDAMPNDNKPPLERPKLIHYNLFSKPWCYDQIQYSEQFWIYAQNCGYLQEILTYKDRYSEHQKRSDLQSMELLVQRGEVISHSDNTFKALYEAGVKIRL